MEMHNLHVVAPSSPYWAIHESTGDNLLATARDLFARGYEPAVHQGRPYAMTAHGDAVIDVTGPLTKYPHSMQALVGGASTLEIRDMVNKAAMDPSVKRIVLNIDSPGGQVIGTEALGVAVARAKESKPVCAFVSDNCHSAAYWIASQATEIVATPASQVGSIGTFLVMHDSSEAFKNEGVKVHVVKAGRHKGMGVEGTPITDDQLAQAQELVDAINEQFVSAVASGRGMSMASARKLADGRSHLGMAALDLGLVDRIVATMDDILSGATPGAVANPSLVATTGQADPSTYIQTDIRNSDENEEVMSEQNEKTGFMAKLSGLFGKLPDDFDPEQVAYGKQGTLAVEVSDELKASIIDSAYSNLLSAGKMAPAERDAFCALAMDAINSDIAAGEQPFIGPMFKSVANFISARPESALMGASKISSEDKSTEGLRVLETENKPVDLDPERIARMMAAVGIQPAAKA